MNKIFIKHDYELLQRLSEASDVSSESIRKTSVKIMKVLIELAENPLPEDAKNPQGS